MEFDPLQIPSRNITMRALEGDGEHIDRDAEEVKEGEQQQSAVQGSIL
jgi:hypothetical protein